ncbi:MAG TPA: twin-arginine translocation signal domain-containing protein [Cyclobacteriaceae bacterium]|nr:twin-arginine translocation signal domain-containing protein [Cyclobacteriaceae bacterium]
MKKNLKIQKAANSPRTSSRRDFLKLTAATAAGMGVINSVGATQVFQSSDEAKPELMQDKDPYALAAKFSKFLRVTDVTDGLDAVGRADLTLLDPAIRPLWMGMRFWGPAVTMRVIPTNRRMPLISKEDALLQHSIWFKSGGSHAQLVTKPGCVIVTSTNGARECGYWGSNNSMGMQANGVVGIVTDGFARDTDEIVLQKNPVACRGIGRTIIPGRVELMDVEVPVACGGVMVRPGDIVGCDWDGVVVVPIEVAEDVLYFAAKIAIDDKKARRNLYDKLGRAPDETVDWEAAAEYFKDIL